MTTTIDAARAAYGSAPRGVRFHVAARRRTCPFAALEGRVPTSGRVLDVGCGHGLLSIALALGAPDRQVVGVDIDEDKIRWARTAARAAGAENVRFERSTSGEPPPGPWDAIVVVDVLYLLGAGPARRLLASVAAGVAPGGVLLVKEIDVRPRWKYELARLQELVATRVVRITEGERVEFLPPADIAGVLAEAGLVVEHVPLHRGRLHPHHLVSGRRPSAT